ncbi:MAG: GGDEF domain-containing protein [Myxococcales bacterium]|nr:GGDEF domain-containing protein [Myxococcales bacterium]
MNLEIAVTILTELASASCPSESMRALALAESSLGAEVESYLPLLRCLARRNEELSRLRSLANRDPLTGVANRRAFQDTLSREQARHDRTGEGFALMLIDLDGLKAINDSLGHSAGDTVIGAVAEAAATTARSSDLVARIGGDEFAVILPATGGAGARQLARRMREAIERVDTLHGRPRVSVGVAACDEPGADPNALFDRADAELYRDKQARKSARHAA